MWFTKVVVTYVLFLDLVYGVQIAHIRFYGISYIFHNVCSMKVSLELTKHKNLIWNKI